MRQVRFALGESDGQLRAGIRVSKNEIGHRFGTPATGKPRFQDRADLINPRHGYGTATLNHDDGVRIGRRDLRDQLILTVWKGQAIQVHSLTFPLVGVDDGHVGVLSQSRSGRGIGT